MTTPLHQMPLSDTWQWAKIHWHAYSDGQASRPAHRPHRLSTTPDAVLTSPVEVADWVETQFGLYAPKTDVPGSFSSADLADTQALAEHRRNTNMVIAGRGQSIYWSVKNCEPSRPARKLRAYRELYVEAVTGCEHAS